MSYSISDLEKLSGIQSHTIRVWERRYKVLKPLRTLGNTRQYDDEQLRKFLSIATLNKTGLKISILSKLSEDDLNKLITETESLENSSDCFELLNAQILKDVLVFDEQKVENTIDRAIKRFGLTETYKNIMHPLLVKLGFLWLKREICPAEEHFLVNIFRQKIMAETNSLALVGNPKQTWLLFLPESECHDVGLLFAKYLIKKAKKKVVYLGSKVPLANVTHLLNTTSISAVLLFLISATTVSQAESYFKKLTQYCKGLPIYVSGNKEILSKIDKSLGVIWLKTVDQFEYSIKTQVAI